MFPPHYEIDYRRCGTISYVYQSVVSTFYFLKRKNTNVERSSLNFRQIFLQMQNRFFLELNYKIIKPKEERRIRV